MTDVSQADLTAYYDLLHLWTRFNKGFRAFSGVEAHAVHRWLNAPETGEFSPATIHKLMLATGIGAHEPVDALDAGCGYGGTMFALREAIGGRWHGVTLSRHQYSVGRRAARDKGVADAITFARSSYDDPLLQRYNFIYAIESLIHSADPARTITNLAQALRPDGTFIIVDDMPADEIRDEFTGDLAQFKKLWRCPVMPSARQWAAHLAAAGCTVVEIRDLSHLMRPRSEHEIAQALEEVANRRRWRDRFGLRRVGEAETGGLLLERLGRKRLVSYAMIVARMNTFRA